MTNQPVIVILFILFRLTIPSKIHYVLVRIIVALYTRAKFYFKYI